MLTIQNVENTKDANFSFGGNEWILHGVDVSPIEYKFIFMPMDRGSGVYDISKSQLVLLNRAKHKRRGYRLWTTDGKHTYIEAKDIRSWPALVNIVYQNRMIC